MRKHESLLEMEIGVGWWGLCVCVCVLEENKILGAFINVNQTRYSMHMICTATKHEHVQGIDTAVQDTGVPNERYLMLEMAFDQPTKVFGVASCILAVDFFRIRMSKKLHFPERF